MHQLPRYSKPKTKKRKSTGKLRSRVTTIDSKETDPGRRGFLQAMAAGGVSVPASYFLLNDPIKSAQAVETPNDPDRFKGNSNFGLRRTDSTPKKAQFIRDFSDPYLELVRLLREAAEVEHSLMIQYLYAAFSIKPVYAGIVGDVTPTEDTFLGVAVQEMQHLGAVNRLLAELGSTPNLATQDLPYEPEIYPFEVKLEACGPVSLSKYSYCEAPTAALDRRKAKTPDDHAYIDQMNAALGNRVRPNLVGSFYDTVIDTLEEYGKTGEAEDELSKPLDVTLWVKKLRAV